MKKLKKIIRDWFRHLFEELGLKELKCPKGEPFYLSWKSRFRSLLRPDLWRSESPHLRFSFKEFLTGRGKPLDWLIFLRGGFIDFEATEKQFEDK